MKRPLVLAAIAVLSGILCGIRETPLLMKTAALIGMAVLISHTIYSVQPEGLMPCYDRTVCERTTHIIAAIIVMILFAAGFLRAAFVSALYRTPEATAFFARYEATNPGQFDYAMYLKGQGIFSEEAYQAFRPNPEISDHKAGFLANTRSLCSEMLDKGFTEHDAGILRAVLLGEKSVLDTEVRDLYQTAGISHLLAVSGLHISILGMGIFDLIRKKKISRWVSGITAGFFIILYLLMIGTPGSGIRAAIMLLIFFTAGALGRFYDMRSSLCLALLIMLLTQPYQVFQSGFQLSYAAVAAIAFTGDVIIRETELCLASRVGGVQGKKRVGKAHRLPVWVKTVIMSSAVQLVMLPVVIWHYFYFPAYGLLLNFIVIPLMAAVLFSGLAVMALMSMGGILTVFLHGYFLPKATCLSAAAAAPGHYTLLLYDKLCRQSLRLPHSSVLFGRPALWQIIAYYTLMGVVVLFFVRIRRFKILRARVPVLLTVLILNAGILRHIPVPELTVTAIDVGQGDGFLIETKQHCVMIDCGSSDNRQLGPRIVAPLLLSKGIKKVDMAVISHADRDHISGLQYLMEGGDGVMIDNLILPGPACGHEKYEGLRRSFQKADSIEYLSDGDELLSDDMMKLSCIYAGNAEEYADTNRHSPALLLEYGSFRMLFTGDMTAADETELCRRWKSLFPGKRVTVLKAAHHGSDTSTSANLLETVDPKYAVISAGRGNRYGHPSEEVTDRLDEYGVTRLETPVSGAIVIYAGKGKMKIDPWL